MNIEELRRSLSFALTLGEGADLLRVDRRTLSKSIDDGEIPVIQIGRRRLIPRDKLLALLSDDSFSEAS